MDFTVLVGERRDQGMFSVELELTELLLKASLSSLRHKELHVQEYGAGTIFHMIRIAETPVTPCPVSPGI